MRPIKVAIASALILACASAPAMLQTGPAPAPALFAPEAVSTDQFESHPAFDPRSGDLLFVRSTPQFQGWRIWRSRCTPAGWAAAQPAEFGAEGVDADPFFTPDGRHLYFISSRADPPAKTTPDLDIWRMDRDQSGHWSAPVRLPAPINSSGAEWFPRLAADGRLYFGSDRPGGHGATDIYAAERQSGSWRVSNLGAGVNGAGDEYEFEPARRGRFAVLMADGGLFRVARGAQGWGPRTALATGQEGFHVGPLLSPSGRTLLFAHGAPGRSGELFRLALGGREEAWPPACRVR